MKYKHSDCLLSFLFPVNRQIMYPATLLFYYYGAIHYKENGLFLIVIFCMMNRIHLWHQ